MYMYMAMYIYKYMYIYTYTCVYIIYVYMFVCIPISPDSWMIHCTMQGLSAVEAEAEAMGDEQHDECMTNKNPAIRNLFVG